MKLTLVLLVAAAVVGCALSCTDESWAQYKETYGKVYDSQEEDLHRRGIYCENLKTINKHNEQYKRGKTTYEMGVNDFTDWTHKEFADWVSGRGQLREH